MTTPTSSRFSMESHEPPCDQLTDPPVDAPPVAEPETNEVLPQQANE